MELKLSNLTRKHKPNTTWPKEKRLQAVAQYLALGNMRLVSATTGIDYGLLRDWKMKPWWKEFETEIRNTENLQLDNTLTKIVERSLSAVADRLENGDPVFNMKTGEIVRKPVAMKDAAKVSVDLLTKRELLRGNATSRNDVQAIPMADQLKALAAEFARMTSAKPQEVIEVEMVEILQGDVDDILDTGEIDAVLEGMVSETGESGEATDSTEEVGGQEPGEGTGKTTGS